ncbi:MAG: hypothetical protein HY961_14455 [Ignavibacteriae bacterium]|nr:hypothetical protein [Ignavibacteriota bacterium]
MKHAILILALAITSSSFAQESADVINQQATLTILPMYQQWSSGGTKLFSEVSSTLHWYQPLSREFSVSLRSSYASSTGNVASLAGINDMQVNFNYYLESADMVFGLGVNVPSGKNKLTESEFETSYLISNSVFRLQVPHYGSGLNLSPSVSWALPLSDKVVVGLGAMYFYRGRFDPVTEITNYDPADEITLSGGCDVRFDAMSSLSLDGVFTLFGKDKVKNIEVFSPGKKLLTGMRFKRYFEFDELTLTVLARFRWGTETRIGNVLLPNAERVEPDQLELGGSYLAKLSTTVSLRFLLEGRFFEESADPLSGAALGVVGTGLEISASDYLTIPLQFKYSFGTIKGDVSLSGLDVAAGLTFTY